MARSLNFPFLMLFLTAAAVTDPADDLPAVFRDPADGLSAAFLRPRCWTPNGRTGREQAMDRRSAMFRNFVFCLNTATKTTANFLCLGQNILVCELFTRVSTCNPPGSYSFPSRF